MFSTAGSQVSSARGGSVGSRSDSLLYPAVVHCYLAGCHSVDLPLVVDVGSLHVDLVEPAVCALHHVVVVDSGDVLRAAT